MDSMEHVLQCLFINTSASLTCPFDRSISLRLGAVVVAGGGFVDDVALSCVALPSRLFVAAHLRWGQLRTTEHLCQNCCKGKGRDKMHTWTANAQNTLISVGSHPCTYQY